MPLTSELHHDVCSILHQSLPPHSPLIQLYGWPSVFYLFAVLGFIWCIIWPLFKPELNLGEWTIATILLSFFHS